MLRMLIGEDCAEVRQDIARIRAAIRRYPQISAVPAHDGRAFRAIAIYPARSQSDGSAASICPAFETGRWFTPIDRT